MSIYIERSEIIVQLEKIQIHAIRMLNSSPSLVEVQNFAEYSNILKEKLEGHTVDEKCKTLIDQIPYIDIHLEEKTSILQLSFIFNLWYNQTTRVKRFQNQIKLATNKYKEIEILLRSKS